MHKGVVHIKPILPMQTYPPLSYVSHFCSFFECSKLKARELESCLSLARPLPIDKEGSFMKIYGGYALPTDTHGQKALC